ncbi:MAG: hypothetical protein JXN61_09520 [Sedimentisphaerales bacterium]|nr:hypothetical protein [Sedimentisphaerales bacterium]
MLRRILVVAFSAVLCLSCLTGCKKDSGDAETVKSETEYKAEAEKEINTENMDEELAKIEKEMEQDLKEAP